MQPPRKTEQWQRSKPTNPPDSNSSRRFIQITLSFPAYIYIRYINNSLTQSLPLKQKMSTRQPPPRAQPSSPTMRMTTEETNAEESRTINPHTVLPISRTLFFSHSHNTQTSRLRFYVFFFESIQKGKANSEATVRSNAPTQKTIGTRTFNTCSLSRVPFPESIFISYP
jgi:hypothetical protein